MHEKLAKDDLAQIGEARGAFFVRFEDFDANTLTPQQVSELIDVNALFSWCDPVYETCGQHHVITVDNVDIINIVYADNEIFCYGPDEGDKRERDLWWRQHLIWRCYESLLSRERLSEEQMQSFLRIQTIWIKAMQELESYRNSQKINMELFGLET